MVNMLRVKELIKLCSGYLTEEEVKAMRSKKRLKVKHIGPIEFVYVRMYKDVSLDRLVGFAISERDSIVKVFDMPYEGLEILSSGQIFYALLMQMKNILNVSDEEMSQIKEPRMKRIPKNAEVIELLKYYDAGKIKKMSEELRRKNM